VCQSEDTEVPKVSRADTLWRKFIVSCILPVGDNVVLLERLFGFERISIKHEVNTSEGGGAVDHQRSVRHIYESDPKVEYMVVSVLILPDQVVSTHHCSKATMLLLVFKIARTIREPEKLI
jgi:hypothetical protein